MSLLRITRFGEPVLAEVAKPVTDLGPTTQKLILDMYETMYAAQGIGLAAPQVGLALRLAVINTTPDKRRNQFVIINPKIVSREGSVSSEEGCLSLPGVGGATFSRASKVVVEAVNENGLPVKITGEGLLARCLQHEIDHLDGRLIIHRARLQRRLKMMWAIHKLKKRGPLVRLKTLFFGTPPVAVPFLEWLAAHTDVVGVVCRTDEPAGRGMNLTAPPTKIAAAQKNIPVFQPAGPWTDDTVNGLKSLNADIGIIVAYGRLLPRPVFMAPKMGSINIHFSLLPLYRGAAPIQWSLINGETRTGVTAFWLEEGLDSGPIFHQAETPIEPGDNLFALREKLVTTGIDVLKRVIEDASVGKLIRDEQKGTPTLARQLKKEDGRITFDVPARDIVNRIRGVAEWPGATTSFQSPGAAPKGLKVTRATLGTGSKGTAGEILSADPSGIVVKASDGAVRLEEVQPEGKKPMAAWSFWQGARLKIGDKLGE